MENRIAGSNCLKESEIEDLARGKLNDKTEQRCLAHVLWCQSCEQKVHDESEFARALQSAAVLAEDSGKAAARQRRQSGWSLREFASWRDSLRHIFAVPIPARWAAVAVSVCVLTAVAVLLPLRRVSGSYQTVELRSERGNAVQAVVESVPGAKLRLQIDVSDVVPYPSYNMAVVDAAGQTIETSALSTAAGIASVTLQRPLSPGAYWIRLSAPDQRLLREYALRIRP